MSQIEQKEEPINKECEENEEWVEEANEYVYEKLQELVQLHNESLEALRSRQQKKAQEKYETPPKVIFKIVGPTRSKTDNKLAAASSSKNDVKP